MCGAECASGLEFNHYSILDHDVQAVLADLAATIREIDRSFGLYSQPVAPEFLDQ